MEQTDSQIQSYLETIKNAIPFTITDVNFHNSGDDFFVIEINGEWMFRFPRNEISARAFVVEKAFLTQFKSVSPLPIPDYRYDGDHCGGYRKVPGTLLTAGVFESLSTSARDRITWQIGQFLSAVHSFPVEDATRLGVTEGWSGFHQQAIQRFKNEVAPVLLPSVRRNALACIEQMMAEKFEPRVIHGDFAFEDHVFYDEARQQLCGVIDFADVTINDPAHDFQNILEYGGETLFQAVIAHYQIETDPALLKRTRLRIQARPLFEATYSLMFGFPERYKERMTYIEANYV